MVNRLLNALRGCGRRPQHPPAPPEEFPRLKVAALVRCETAKLYASRSDHHPVLTASDIGECGMAPVVAPDYFKRHPENTVALTIGMVEAFIYEWDQYPGGRGHPAGPPQVWWYCTRGCHGDYALSDGGCSKCRAEAF